tara:strand:- start:1690 stop:3243 length:1554 start_codon:yes stop_codon:yes gene_type:complete
MIFDIAIIGFGVIGTESLYKITKNLNKSDSIKIAIIERDISKIPGGIAYSKENSKFGFFNNPLRLSNLEFIRWIKKKQNINKLCTFIKENKDFNLEGWLIKNKNFERKNIKKFDEIYLPRLTYSFFLEEKIKNIMKFTKNKKVVIKFYQSELFDIEKKENYLCKLNKTTKEFKPKIVSGKVIFQKIKNKNIRFVKSKSIILGNGILPPKAIYGKNHFNNNNYIWDFYAEGGTLNLINKINKIKDKKKNIKIIFIGNKAGLLETMPELENFISNNVINIDIISIAPSRLSLEKAEQSKLFNYFKFQFLIEKNIKGIEKSNKILELLKKEFNLAKKNGFNRYDVWTWVLKKRLISKCYNKLSASEQKKYNEFTFPLIRNITRYTYPSTIYSKKRLEKKKILTFIKDKVEKLEKFKKYIKIKTVNGLTRSADIVVNVSGPVNLEKISKESTFISSLKNIFENYNYRGFIVDKDFCIGQNIYAPGTISSNFNPNRLTIIKAVTQNSHKASNKILKVLNIKS